MKTKYSLGLAFAFLMSGQIWYGCKVSKDVALPDMHLPVSFRDKQGSNDTTTIAAISWQNFFQDGELKTLINEALAHNNDLSIAIKNIEAARLVVRQAKLGNIPQVTAGATASLDRPSDNSLNGLSLSQELHESHIEDYTASVYLSWEADIWGKIRSQKAAALAAFLSSEEARRTLQTEIISEIAKGYYNLLLLDAQLAIARKNVALLDSTLTITRLQFQAGQLTSLAAQQVEAQKLSAELLVPQFEQATAVQENALSILTGRIPQSIPRSSLFGSDVFAASLQPGIPAELLQNRPDIRMAALEVSRSNATVGYAKANLYPSFTITAQAGLDALKASNWFTIPASLFGAVTGSILQPVFQQKKLKTQFEIAKVNREQQVILFRQSVLTAVGEVSDALVRTDKLKIQSSITEKRTAVLQNATANAQLLFKNGMANYLEVITAESDVLKSELESASITNQRLSATIDLYRSLGGGWNETIK
jgi:multidrug efflux system outer membrane protein